MINTPRECQESIFMNRYRMGRNIGQGSQGQVKLALDTTTGNRVAIKIFKHRKMNDLDFIYLNREVNILQQLRGHYAFVNLIEFIDNECYTNGHGQKESVSAIVMEYASNGCLFGLVSFFREKYSESIIKIIALQLLDAIEHMQKFSISHRDIKLENIVLDSNYNLKVIDFGLAVQESKDGMPKSNVGTSPFAPPERFLGKEYCGLKFDVFSLGVLLFFLKFNSYPFINNNPEYFSERGSFSQFSNNRSYFWQQIQMTENVEDVNFLHLIDCLLQSNPTHRPSLEEIRNHPFLITQDDNHNNNKIIISYLSIRKEIMTEKIKNQRKEMKNKLQDKIKQVEANKHLDNFIFVNNINNDNNNNNEIIHNNFCVNNSKEKRQLQKQSTTDTQEKSEIDEQLLIEGKQINTFHEVRLENIFKDVKLRTDTYQPFCKDSELINQKQKDINFSCSETINLQQNNKVNESFHLTSHENAIELKQKQNQLFFLQKRKEKQAELFQEHEYKQQKSLENPIGYNSKYITQGQLNYPITTIPFQCSIIHTQQYNQQQNNSYDLGHLSKMIYKNQFSQPLLNQSSYCLQNILQCHSFPILIKLITNLFYCISQITMQSTTKMQDNNVKHNFQQLSDQYKTIILKQYDINLSQNICKNTSQIFIYLSPFQFSFIKYLLYLYSIHLQSSSILTLNYLKFFFPRSLLNLINNLNKRDRMLNFK